MPNLEYKRFRVRTPVRSFRDLEVYQTSINLSAALFKLKVPVKYKKDAGLVGEVEKLREITKAIPRLIAESYSDKFTDLPLAGQKLEQAAQIANGAVMKIDFLNAIVENNDFRENLTDVLRKYQRVKIKIINLKRAWNRVFGENRLACQNAKKKENPNRQY